MSDKRTVTTDALETLGTIIDDTQKRDAIHLAVEPVTAGEDLISGEHVTVINGVALSAPRGKGQGIVDPFLTEVVKKGARFWFVMYPRQVHSLRHVWTHPDFPDEAGTPSLEADVPAGIVTLRKKQSEEWLRRFCNEANCPGYDTVMAIIGQGTLPKYEEYEGVSGEYTDEYLHFRGSDAHGTIPPEFWTHAEVVLGIKLPHHPQYFSCSC